MEYFLGPETKIPAPIHKNITIQYDMEDTSPKTGCRKFHLVLPTTHIHSIHLSALNNDIYFVIGCVSQKTLEMIKNKEASEVELKARADHLFKVLDPKLKARIVTLVRDDKKTISAIKLFEEEAKVSRAEANQVVDLVCDDIL